VGGVKRLLAVAAGAAAWLVVLGLPSPAHADEVSDAITALRNGPVYVAPGAAEVDANAVSDAIGDQSVKIAVLPEVNGSAYDIAIDIGRTLGGSITVGVVEGNNFNAASSAYCEGFASVQARDATRAHQQQLDTDDPDLTAMLVDFVGRVDTGPAANTSACGAAAGGGGDRNDLQGAEEDSGGSVWPWVLGIGALGAAGGGAYALVRRRRHLKDLEGQRAEVLSLYDRLGADVQHLDHKDDPVAQMALADAAERYTATGSLLSHADTDREYEAARRTALEGLQAARTARKTLGLDLGPDLPPIAPTYGEQLREKREVTVGGKTYDGYPEYTPGAPYYYGGGGGVPGGWYAFPFWETLLIGSVLTGGFGGWGGGGYDQGFEAGRESAEQDSGGGDGGGGDSGGDWGGGDWGSGGGDWGGGGGGDWGGGGGGDFGGGGDSGGGSW
jgi:hypothetical protein